MSAASADPERTVGRPFQKGVSGNPGGQCREVVEMKRALAEVGPEVVAKLIRWALGSEVSEKAQAFAMKEILDRVFGKAAVQLQMTVDTQVTLMGIIAGLSPEQAAKRAQ